MKLIFLGTGSSSGTPVPGCECAVCLSKSDKDKRNRPAVLFEKNGKTLLIDAPQELRLQLVRHSVKNVHAMLITHCHADHVYGLDDIRIFSRFRKIPLHADITAINELKKIFPYVFVRTQKAGGKPRIKLNTVNSSFVTNGFNVTPLPVFHGNKKISGWRIDNVAYMPDVSRIPPSTFRLLGGLRLLVIDALRHEPHPTHITIDNAIEISRLISPEQTIFTHISHNLPHALTNRSLPRRVMLAYDGLVVNV